MKILIKILASIGGTAVIVVAAAVAFFAYQMGPSAEKVNKASKKDVLFILNWGGLENTQDYEVLSSYQSPQTFLPDHLDYYCLQLEKFNPNSEGESTWVFGTEETSLINEARKLLASSGKASQCFNTPISGIEQDVAAYIWAVRVHGRNVSGAQIIFYHKPTNRLLYVSLET
jgi:hypothetical protein